jgi:prepilin-type processing-associated H-X9-DG protein
LGTVGPFAIAGDPSNGVSVSLSSLNTSSFYVLSGDCNYASDPTNADLNNNYADTLFTPTNLPPPIHVHRVNILFADWHVKSYKNFKAGEITFSLVNPGYPYY